MGRWGVVMWVRNAHASLSHTNAFVNCFLLPDENANVYTSWAVGTAYTTHSTQHTYSYQLWRAGHIPHFNLPEMTMLLRQSLSLSAPSRPNLVCLIEFLQQQQHQNPNNSQITRYSHLHFICLFLGELRESFCVAKTFSYLTDVAVALLCHSRWIIYKAGQDWQIGCNNSLANILNC